MAAAKHNVLEMPGNLAESRLQSRALFLASVLNLRPHVISDLWETALFDFKSVILNHFFQELFGDLECELEDYFKEKQEEFAKSPHAHPDFLVDRIQQRLAPGWTTLSSDPVRDTFRFWTSLKDKQADTLREKILDWSKRWNLDADWCRDHALAVLREWLFNDALKWLHVFPHSTARLQATGWSSAVTELKLDSAFSRFLADEEVHGRGKNPEPFSFRPSKQWPDRPFEITWNTTKETEIEFRKKADVTFRICLATIEAARLRDLAENDSKRNELPTREFEKELAWRNGMLQEYDRALDDYITRMTAVRENAKSERNILEAQPLPEADVFEWLVLYQVLQLDKSCLSYRQIAETNDCSEVHVRKRVENAASMIDLGLRDRYLHSGRPRGTGKPITHRATR